MCDLVRNLVFVLVLKAMLVRMHILQYSNECELELFMELLEAS